MAVDAGGNVFVAGKLYSPLVELDYADPPSLTFATTTVGIKSSNSPQKVTVSNNGNANLTFTGLSYPTDFPSAGSGTNLCQGTTVLSAGDECDLDIDFSPLSVGTPLREHVTLTDNPLNLTGTQQTVPVSGNAFGPPSAVSVNSILGVWDNSAVQLCGQFSERGRQPGVREHAVQHHRVAR